MKKIVLILFAALFVLAGCDNSNAAPETQVEQLKLDVPIEFRGTWKSIDLNSETGTHEVLEISQHEIASDGMPMAESINLLFNSFKEFTDEYDVPFEVMTSQSHPYYGRYTFGITATAGFTSMYVNNVMELENGQLKVTMTGPTDESLSGTGEIKYETTIIYYEKINQ